MSGAGDLKNSIQSLKRTLLRNNIFQKADFSIEHFQEEYLQNNNPKMFLKVTHYIMIQYSPVLYAKILQKYPNIKLVSDKEFMTACYVCIRQFFDTFPSLTIDQFCTSKFLELKVKFLDELINIALIWLSKNKKSKVVKEQKPPKMGKVENVTKNSTRNNFEDCEQPKPINVRATHINKLQDDDSDLQEQPRSLKYKPQFKYEEDQNEDTNQRDIGLNKYINNQNKGYKLQSNNPKIPTSFDDQVPPGIKNSKKPSYFKDEPVRLKPSAVYSEQKSITYDLQPQNDNMYNTQPEQQSTQSQINDLFELVGNVSLTVNELVGKFNVFQNNVSDWVKNINAKVDILESTVKTIKDNL